MDPDRDPRKRAGSALIAALIARVRRFLKPPRILRPTRAGWLFFVIVFGVGFAAQGFEASSYYRRNDASRNPRAAFIFEGIEDERIGDFGSLGGGAAGEEIDRYDVRLGSPRHALVVASSEAHDEYMLRTKEEFLTTVLPFQDPKIRADMVFFECPNGGAVFSTGSIAWAGALAHNHYDNNVAAVTANVLRRFIDARAFEEW